MHSSVMRDWWFKPDWSATVTLLQKWVPSSPGAGERKQPGMVCWSHHPQSVTSWPFWRTECQISLLSLVYLTHKKQTLMKCNKILVDLNHLEYPVAVNIIFFLIHEFQIIIFSLVWFLCVTDLSFTVHVTNLRNKAKIIHYLRVFFIFISTFHKH